MGSDVQGGHPTVMGSDVQGGHPRVMGSDVQGGHPRVMGSDVQGGHPTVMMTAFIQRYSSLSNRLALLSHVILKVCRHFIHAVSSCPNMGVESSVPELLGHSVSPQA